MNISSTLYTISQIIRIIMVINQNQSNSDQAVEKESSKSWFLTTAGVEDTHVIESLQSELLSRGLPETYEIKDPHITLLPPINCSSSTRSTIHDRLNTSPLKGATIQVNGAGVWPNITNPRVILLDIEFKKNIEKLRQSLLDIVGHSNVRYPPSPFHITLAKARRTNVSSNAFKHSVQDFIANNRTVWHTRSSEYNIKNVI